MEKEGRGEITEKDGKVETKNSEESKRVSEAMSLVCLGPEAQGSWERLASGWSRGRGAGLGKAVGGRPRGPRGRRRRQGDRMPGSRRRLPPPPRAASWGAGPQPSNPLSRQSLSDPLPVLTAAVGFLPHLSSPQLPPTPPLAPRRHAPSLFSCSGAAPSPNSSGPLAFPSPPGESPVPNRGAWFLSDPGTVPGEAQNQDSWVSASQGRKLRALRLREPESRVSRRMGCSGPTF